MAQKSGKESVLSNSLSRRSFIGAAVASSALLAAGCSPESQMSEATEGADARIYRTDADVDESVEGKWVTGACWHNCGGRCVNKVYVADGVVTRQKTDDFYEDSEEHFQNRSCPRGHSQRQQVFGVDRLKYPVKRKNWSPENPHPELRGIDEWERITWDEAMKYIVDETKRIYETYGPSSVFFCSPGFDHVAYSLNLMGGFVRIEDIESYGSFTGCTEALGTSFINRTPGAQLGNDRLDLPNADTIVLYSMNPAWASAGSPMYHFLKARESGTEFVYVGPSFNVSAQALDARWIPVRPGTDTAFLLAVAYEMLQQDAEKDLIDWDFLHEYCVGFDSESMPADAKLDENFMDYVLGAYDGMPKTAEWASVICGTPVEDIRWYAEKMDKKKNVMTLFSYAAARYYGTENLQQALLTVGCMGAHLGKSGNATALNWHFECGNSGPRIVKGGATVDSFVANPIQEHTVAASAVWQSILDGKYLHYGAGDAYSSYPTYLKVEERPLDIHMFIAGNRNKLQSNNDINKGIEALRSLDFVWGYDYKPSLSVMYSDVVVPICTKWEGYAANIMVDYMNRDSFLAMQAVVEEPLYEAKCEQDMARLFAEGLGLNIDELFPATEKEQWFQQVAGAKVFTGGKLRKSPSQAGCEEKANYDGDEPEVWENICSVTQEDLDKYGVDYPLQEGLMSFEDLLEQGSYQAERREGDGKGWIGYKDFIDDPEKYPRNSPSGKLEIYCQTKADDYNRTGASDVEMKPYANYFVPKLGYETMFDDWDGGVMGEYDLQMFQPHYLRRAHTTLDNLTWLQEGFENPIFMNAADARQRGIETGDTVLVTSKAGSILRHASVIESLMPGACALPHGAHSDFDPATGIDLGGNENTLCPTEVSNYGLQLWGANACPVKIEKWAGDALRYDYEKQFLMDAE